MAAHGTDLKNQVIDALRDNNGPMDTVAIAKVLGMATRKQINPALYKLHSQGVIVRVSDSPPKWGLKHEVTLGQKLQRSTDCKTAGGFIEPQSEEMMSSVPTSDNEGSAAECLLQEAYDGRPAERTVQYVVGSPLRTSSPSQEECYRGPVAPLTTANPEWDRENRDYYYSPPNGRNEQRQVGSPNSRSSSSSNEETDGSCHGPARNGFIPENNPKSLSSIDDLSSLDHRLFSALLAQRNPIHSNELAKLVGMRSKREINPTLFGMQKKGLVLKVFESPPLWVAVQRGGKAAPGSRSWTPVVDNAVAPSQKRSAEPWSQNSHSYDGRGLPPTPNMILHGADQRGGSSQHPPRPNGETNVWEAVLNEQSQNGTSGMIESNRPTAEGQLHGDARGGPQPLSSFQLTDQVLRVMSNGRPITTTDIMHAVGCKACREVNPTIYNMYRNKLLERVQEVPPVWMLSPLGMEKAHSCLPADVDASEMRTQERIQEPVQEMFQQGLRTGSAAVVAPAATTVSSEMFGAINKNPISALTEYAQSRHLPVVIDMIHQQGPPHNPRFTFCARVGNSSFPHITSRSKKDGRREAADIALRSLIAEGSYQPRVNSAPLEVTPTAGNTTTFYDRIAGLSHQTFNSIAASIPDNISGRKVLAALIMKTGDSDEGRVISLGTGNRCVTGDMLSLEGGTVNDSHAEIITRRAFLRYLYNQLAEFKQRPESTIIAETAPGRFRVRQGVTFHLYISTAPCGDGAQFSRTDAGENAEGPEVELELTGHAPHLPTFGKSIQGLLRTKMEYGEGTIPVDSSHPVQTWDGIIRGERLRTMSCSDKVSRWNILGLQGALLSHYLEPLYLSSVTLGSLYHHGHLSRATCCRLSHSAETQELTTSLPTPYRVNHPQLGCVTAFDPPRGTEKTKALSINWFADCPGPEVTDGTKGRVQSVAPSQLCKSTLFAEFQRVGRLYGRDDLLRAKTYNEAKRMAGEFEAAKRHMKECFVKGGYGVWIEKPVEEELFAP